MRYEVSGGAHALIEKVDPYMPTNASNQIPRKFLPAGAFALVLVAPLATALPAAAASEPNPSNVLVHYDMSHDGSRLLDTSGRGLDATIRGGAGKFSRVNGDDVLKFDGSTFVELPNFVGKNDSVVVELKYTDGTRDNEGLFSLGTTSDNDYFRFHPNASGRYLWETKTRGTYLKSQGATAVGSDGWVTASAVLRPDASADLVLNGALQSNVRTGETISHYASVNGDGVAGYLGKAVWAGDPLFTGTLTDVMVYTVPAPTAPASTPTKVISTSFPASSDGNNWWRSSMITGNGENGALVAGNPVSDTLIYQNISFNLPSNTARETPDIASSLETNRRTLVNGGEVAGNPVPGQGMQWDYSFHPGHQLQLQVPGGGVPTNHYRWTDYRTGEVGVNYTDTGGDEWERRTFSSRTDNVVITHLTRSASGKPIDLNLDIAPVDSMAVEAGALDGNLRYKQIAGPDASYIGQVAHYPSYAGSELASAGYAGVTSIVTKGGTKTLRETAATGRRAVPGSRLYGVDIRGAEEVFLITRSDRDKQMGTLTAFPAQTTFRLVDTLVSSTAAVAANPAYQGAGGLDYEKLLAPHSAAHGAEFDAVKLDLNASPADRGLTNEQLLARQKATPGSLDTAMVERAFAAGRYATISSSGFSAPRLGGMWTGAWNPQWSGDWTTDANINLQVAGANIGALPSEMDGFINLLLRITPDWETNAARIYGMQDAALAPPRTDADNGAMYHFGDDYPFQYWNAGASWLLLPLYEYWLVHGNVEVPLAADIDIANLASILSPTATNLTDAQLQVIRERGTLRLGEDLLLPLLRKQSNFWDQLTDPRYFVSAAGKATFVESKTSLSEGEKYLLLPCYSPENKPANRWSPVAMNCSMDIAAARDGLRMTMDIERALGAVTPGGKWQKLSDDLPPVTYDSQNGALKEWSLTQFDEQHAHRHVSQAYSAWPAHDTQTSPEMAAGLSMTLALRKQTAGDKSSGHGWLHMGLIDARLKDAAGVDDALRNLLGTRSYYSSFTTNHNITGDSSYVTDILATVPAVLLESMVYSDRETIQILPAIPNGLTTGSLSGSLARTRAEISTLSWDLPGKTATAVIRSDIDQTVKLSSGQKWASMTVDGRTYRNTGAPVSIPFTAGQTSTIVFHLGEPPVVVATELSVGSRCVSGRATVTTTVKNISVSPVSIEMTSEFGKKSILSVAPGRSVSQAIVTRRAQITAGEVTVTAAGQVDGRTVTATQKAGYEARTCG